MNDAIEHCRALKDEDLCRELGFLAEREKRDLSGLLAHLAEFDRRRLSRDSGYESTFMYCVRVLRYDEGGAYRRVHAARVVKRYPRVLEAIEKGELTLTSLLLLSPVLTDENHLSVFQRAKHKTKREIETIVAALDPQAPIPDSMRRLPSGPEWTPNIPTVNAGREIDDPLSSGAEIIPPTPPKEWQAVMPLTAERVRIGFDAAMELMKLIDRAKQVLRHKYPDGKLEDLVREAFEILLERKDPQKKLAMKPGEVDRVEPRLVRTIKSGRYIPMWVRRAVWARDAGRCAWRFDDGTVCGSRDWLEYDHVVPFARGGTSNTPRNIRLACRTHNRLAAEAAGLIPRES